MSGSATGRRCLLFFLLLVLATVPSANWGQLRLRRSEVDVHLKAATEGIARRSGVDRATEERTRKALQKAFNVLPTGVPVLDEGKAERSIARALRAQKFGLASDSTGLKLLRKPDKRYGDRATLRMSRDLVKYISSDIRRRSIVAEIGSGVSQTLDYIGLGHYLEHNLKVPDHEDVKNSFETTQQAYVITLQKDTTLLRLYGGASKPIGRYFFCCLWTNGTSSSKTQWSDAGGLATPPENLRDSLAAVTIPAGTMVIVGIVADNFANGFGTLRPGGNTQIFVPLVKTSFFQKYMLKGNTTAASEILVASDDRILRFRPKAEE